MDKILIIYSIFLIYYLIFYTKKKFFLQVFGSFVWSVLIVFPTLFQYKSLNQEVLVGQVFGVIAVGLAFNLSEYVLFKLHRDRLSIKVELIDEKSVQFSYMLFVGVVFTLVTQWYHLYKMPSIPLFYYIKIGKQTLALTQMREEAAKLLDVAFYYKYLFQITNIIAPIIATILLRRKNYIIFSFFFAATAFYSVSTTAKSTIYLYIIILISPLYFKSLYLKTVADFSARALVVVIFLYSIVTHIFFDNTGLVHTLSNPSHSEERAYTYTDRYRLTQHLPFIGLVEEDDKYLNIAGSFFYRLILVPSEVANMWYSYYPKINKGFVGFDGLTPSSRSKKSFHHPSNRVGFWAYHSFIPRAYLKSTHAYSSIDSSSYARFGFVGIIIAALFIFITNFLFQYYNDKKTILCIIFTPAILLFSLMTPMASLEALLVAQGMIVFIGLALLLFIKKVLYERRSFIA